MRPPDPPREPDQEPTDERDPLELVEPFGGTIRDALRDS